MRGKRRHDSLASWHQLTAIVFCGVTCLPLSAHSLSLREMGCIRATSYNPLTICQEGRLDDICRETRSDLLGLQGTCKWRYQQEPYSVQKTKSHVFIHWGCSRAWSSGRCAGVSLGLGRQLKESMIVSIRSPPAWIGGRGGFARLKSGWTDLSVFVLYFPPPGAMQGRWRKVSEAIAAWVEEVLLTLPARTQVIMMLDANSDLGVSASGERVGPEHVAADKMARQNANGDLLSSILETHALSATSTHWTKAPTFHGNRGSRSTIDHIITCQPTRHATTKCSVWYRAGRRLQVIKDELPRDHLPVVIEINLKRCRSSPPPSGVLGPSVPWDMDKLGEAVQEGGCRSLFLTDLATELVKKEELLSRAEEEDTVDNHWDVICSTIKESAAKFFTKGKRQITEDEREWAVERETLLKHRASLRASLGRRPAIRFPPEPKSVQGGPVPSRTEIGSGGAPGRRPVAVAAFRFPPEPKSVQGGPVPSRTEIGSGGAPGSRPTQEGRRLWTATDWRIHSLTSLLRKKVRARARARLRRLEVELRVAWSRRQMSDCYRLANLIANKNGGSRGRRWGHIAAARPSVEEWKDCLLAPGKEGGMSATVVDYEEEVLSIKALANPLPTLTATHIQRGQHDARQMGFVMSRSSKRRGAPPWSMPLEIFQLCMSPDFYSRKRRGVEGLGAEVGVPAGTARTVTKRLTRLLIHNRRCGEAPCIAHRSAAFQVDKHNGATSTKAVRLIHNICPFWKVFYKKIMVEGARAIKDPDFWPSYMMGFISGRRREDAIASVSIMGHRLRAAGRHYVDSYHDMANAFASTNKDMLIEESLPLVLPQDQALLEQRITNSCCHISALGGSFDFVAGEGAFMGTAEAPLCFLSLFKDKVREWNIESYSHQKEMGIRCSIFEGVRIDGSLATFADDIARKLLVEGGTTAAAVREVKRNTESLSAAIAPTGLAQNVSKLDLVCHLRNGSQNLTFAKEAVQLELGSVVPHARHLGSRQSWNGSTYHETRNRISSMRKAWASMGTFWVSGAPRSVKRLLFIARVQGAGLSALEAFTPKLGELRAIDSFIIKRLRVMLKGRAFTCAGDDESHGHSMSAVEVLRWWKLCPTMLEVTIRRLRWLQAVVAAPAAHRHLIAVTWGCLAFEHEPTIDNEGVLSATANPFASQLLADLATLAAYGVAEEFTELWVESGLSWRALFLDPHLRDTFCWADMRALRSAFWLHGPTGGEAIDPEGAEAELELPHECSLKTEVGECGKRFATRAALRAHQSWEGSGGEHGLWSTLSAAVPTNECPWCQSVFVSRAVAAKHATMAARFGRCCVDNALQAWPLIPPASLDCVLCDYVAGDYDSLRSHMVAVHLPKPQPAFVFLTPRPPQESSPRALSDGGHSSGSASGITARLQRWWQGVQERRRQGSGVSATGGKAQEGHRGQHRRGTVANRNRFSDCLTGGGGIGSGRGIGGRAATAEGERARAPPAVPGGEGGDLEEEGPGAQAQQRGQAAPEGHPQVGPLRAASTTIPGQRRLRCYPGRGNQPSGDRDGGAGPSVRGGAGQEQHRVAPPLCLRGPPPGGGRGRGENRAGQPSRPYQGSRGVRVGRAGGEGRDDPLRQDGAHVQAEHQARDPLDREGPVPPLPDQRAPAVGRREEAGEGAEGSPGARPRAVAGSPGGNVKIRFLPESKSVQGGPVPSRTEIGSGGAPDPNQVVAAAAASAADLDNSQGSLRPESEPESEDDEFDHRPPEPESEDDVF